MTDKERLAEIDRWLGTPGTITKLMPRDVEEREEDVHALRRLLDARDREIAELRLTHAVNELAFDLMQKRLKHAENAEAERDAARAQVRNLTKQLDDKFGTPCEQIRLRQERDAAQESERQAIMSQTRQLQQVCAERDAARAQFMNRVWENHMMDFSQALQQIKAGHRMARTGWNGKDMFVFLVPGSTFEVNRPPLLGIYPEGTVIRYHPHIDMKTADGYVVPWLASQGDLLATDWVSVTA